VETAGRRQYRGAGLFSGFSLKQAERLDSIQWQWEDLVAEARAVVVRQSLIGEGSACMGVPLLSGPRKAPGFLYVERKAAFTTADQGMLQDFATSYTDVLWRMSPAIREHGQPPLQLAPADPGLTWVSAPEPSTNPLVLAPEPLPDLHSSLEVLTRLQNVWDTELEIPVPAPPTTPQHVQPKIDRRQGGISSSGRALPRIKRRRTDHEVLAEPVREPRSPRTGSATLVTPAARVVAPAASAPVKANLARAFESDVHARRGHPEVAPEPVKRSARKQPKGRDLDYMLVDWY
jgi:hypothetical protein